MRAGFQADIAHDSFLVTVESACTSEVRIVGSAPELGSWCVERGLLLRPDRGVAQLKRWVGEVRISGSNAAKVEYKVVIVGPDGGKPLWEPGPNRELRRRSLECAESRSLEFGELEKFSPEPPRACGSPGACQVIWEVECSDANPGDQLCVVGSAAALGDWDPRRGLRLQTTAATFPMWRGSVKLPPASWKLVLLRANGELEWEPGMDRRWFGPPCLGEEAESWVAQGSFGCSERTDLIPVVRGPAGESAGGEPRATLQAPEGLSMETAEAVHVEAVVQGASVRWLLPFERSTWSWSLNLAKAGEGADSRAVHFMVSGEKVACILSKAAPAVAQPGAATTPTTSPASADSASQEARDGQPKSPKQCKNNSNIKITRGPSLSSIASTQEPLSEEDDTASCSDDARRSRLNSPVGGDVPETAPLTHEELDRLLRPQAQPCIQQGGDNAPERCMHLWSGAHRIPKPGGRCEDSFFCGEAGLGVADGVGSMAQFKRHGVDAAAYAADLMQTACEAVNPGNSTEHGPTASSIADAAVATAEAQAVTYGASTITVLSLLDGMAGVANLGDSGFMILRETPQGMSVVMRSTEQQHSWNCPYQLMRLPTVLAKQAATRGIRIDTAADSQSYEFPVLPGDLLLLFTDGLGDNLHEHEVLQVCSRAKPPGFGESENAQPVATSPEDLARALALAARERSRDLTAWVPFSETSRRHGHQHVGGKEDDITVVAAWVMPGTLRP